MGRTNDGWEKERIFLTEDTRLSECNPFRAFSAGGTNLKHDGAEAALVASVSLELVLAIQLEKASRLLGEPMHLDCARRRVNR